MIATAAPPTPWEPQPGPQRAAATCPIADLFYGGERGGGKSDFLLGDWLNHSSRYGEHSSGILFRRTYDELTELIKRSQQMYRMPGATWRASGDPGHCWTMPNGSRFLLRYLDRDEDAERYLGHQYTWMGVDQVEQFPDPSPINRLWGSLRSAHGIPVVRRMTGNPPAPQWLRARYIDAAPWGTPFEYMPQPDLRPDIKVQAIFIHSRLEDNALLLENDPGYDSRLAAAGSEALYRAWRMGDWDATVGQVFKEWRRDLHILNTFTPPPVWEPIAGLDWGYRAPFVLTFGWVGPESEIVITDELSGTETHADEAGYLCGVKILESLNAANRMERVIVHADEQMWYKTGTGGLTIAEEFQNGLDQATHRHPDVTPQLVESTHGRGSRLMKKQLFHRYLSWTQAPDGSVPPWGRPLLRFHRRCEYMTRSLPMLQYSKKATRLEDVDTDGDDHGYDSAGCILVSRPPLPERPQKPIETDKHPGMAKAGRKMTPYEKTMAGEREREMRSSRLPRFRMPRERVEAD